MIHMLLHWLSGSHDVVYEPQALDNELKSAELFEQLMAQDLQLDTMQKIKHWILATQKHAPTDETDLQFLLDIDLAILAATPERFIQYEQQIQQEYSWVDPEVYSIKRKEVLMNFISLSRFIKLHISKRILS